MTFGKQVDLSTNYKRGFKGYDITCTSATAAVISRPIPYRRFYITWNFTY